MTDDLTKPLLDEIALEYAHNWVPLEYARNRLLEQRSTMLDQLADALDAELKKHGLRGGLVRSNVDDLAQRYFDIEGEFVKAKRSRGINVRFLDGVQIVSQVAQDGQMEVRTELYFRMHRKRYDALYSTIREQVVGHDHGGHTHRDRYAIMTLDRAAVGSEAFSRERLLAAVTALPEAFIRADSALASAFLARGAEDGD